MTVDDKRRNTKYFVIVGNLQANNNGSSTVPRHILFPSIIYTFLKLILRRTAKNRKQIFMRLNIDLSDSLTA